MEMTAHERGPAVTRLCIATLGTMNPGPLTSIQRSGDFYRLYITAGEEAGAELAVAAPGIDVVSLVSDLIDALRAEVTIAPRQCQPVLAGFHVGITRLLGDTFAGTGTIRAGALTRNPAIRAASMTPPDRGPGDRLASPVLGVAVSAGLFEELRDEGLPGGGWNPVQAACAWLKLFGGTAQ